MNDDVDIAEAAFEPLAKAAAGNPAALLKLARLAARRNNYDRAAALAQQARALVPGDPEVELGAADVIAQTVPGFHMPMMRDAARAAAFEGAIQRHVKPGMRVLDVGSGSGLLAMMAARAGATHTYSCELQTPVADVAREIVALNGYADRITVLNKHSKDIGADTDLDGRVDLVVAEILASDVVAEHVLPSMRDVVRRLAKPGARLIPQAAEIRVALAWWNNLDREYVGEVAGFDLTPFNRLVRPEFHISVDSPSLSLSGPAATLFTFDFSATDQGAEQSEIMLTSDGRPANGIVQWLHLQLDEGGVYENRPGAGSWSSWDCYFHPFGQPVSPEPGSSVAVAGTVRGNRLRLWAVDDAEPRKS